MKFFEANEELDSILRVHGFIETTSERDKRKGKKSFKLSKNAQKEIYFDYINITIWNKSNEQDSLIRLTVHQLKLLLMYFIMSNDYRKEILVYDRFEYDKASQKFDMLKQELNDLKEFNLKKARQLKIEKILSIYDSIQLN